MKKKDYIVVTSSENDDIPDMDHIHHEDDLVSLRAMHDHGVSIENNTNIHEEISPDDSVTRALLSKSGVEIMRHEEGSEESLG